MSLLSTDIASLKRFSLKGVKLLATDKSGEPQGGGKQRLLALAQILIEGECSYTREKLVARILGATKASQERAEVMFAMFLLIGAIENTFNPEHYYLTGSTPF